MKAIADATVYAALGLERCPGKSFLEWFALRCDMGPRRRDHAYTLHLGFPPTSIFFNDRTSANQPMKAHLLVYAAIGDHEPRLRKAFTLAWQKRPRIYAANGEGPKKFQGLWSGRDHCIYAAIRRLLAKVPGS